MAEMPAVARYFVNLSSGRRARRFLGWIRGHISVAPTAEVLEVGAGAGRLAVRWVREVPVRRYLATEYDPRQLAAAARTVAAEFPDGAPPALLLARADIARLAQPAASVDLVVASVALHHAGPDHRSFDGIPRGLAEIDRVLRGGGQVVYSEMFHRRAIREWFVARGYAVVAERRGWRTDFVAVRKPVGPGATTPGSEPTRA